jgi:ABC-type bacteriocin/lantibiotic exporter with double-glycine peptidase domain
MFDIFKGRSFGLMNICIFIQQLMVASSTFFIVKLSQSVADHEPFFIWVILFILSLTLVYLPSSLMLYFAEAVKYDSLKAYLSKFSLTYFSKTSWRSNRNLKDELYPYVSTESFAIISQFVEFYYYWVGFLLNILFNILFFGALLDSRIFVAYIVSIILSLVGTKIFSKGISAKTIQCQAKKNILTSKQYSAWDNVLIGNLWNFKVWQGSLNSAWTDSRKNQLSLVFDIELLSSLTSLFTMLPVFIIIAHLFIAGSTNWGFLAVLIATLPRHVQTIQNVSTIVQMSFQWSNISSKVKLLNSSLIPTKADHSGQVNWKDLSFVENGKSVAINNFTEIQKHIVGDGRLTIRGKNGGGKSSLAAKIKEFLGETAVYLPAHSELEFQKTIGLNFSTGQKIVASIDEIVEKSQFTAIILDEWDANLDESNVRIIQDKLEALSKRCRVIEIRHKVGLS